MSLPFVGPSYSLATRKASAQRSVNMHLVGMETPSKAPYIMRSVPGLVLFAALGAEVRGSIYAASRCFVVAGATLFEISSTGAATARGTLSTASGAVGMAWGTTQLVVVDGANGYVLTLSGNAFASITDPDWPGSATIGYINGFFTLIPPGRQQCYITAIDDASNIDALDFASAESSPDLLVGQVITHNEWWQFGEFTTEVRYPSDNAFPFDRNSGATMDVGCIAAHSIRSIDNGVIWIGQDRNGSGMVYKVVGYQPQRISTTAIEEALRASTDLSQAVAYVYQLDGLTFWCVNAPGLTSTWCYEVSSGAWFEVCDLDALGQFKAGRATHHVAAFGLHLVGDAAGNLYRMDRTVYTNNGDALVRMRISPNDVTPQRERKQYGEFVLDCTTGEAGQGIAPVAELSWSNDSGATFGNPVMKSIGLVGERVPRVRWTRLGLARDRVWKLVFSGNAPFDIISGSAG